MGVQTADGIAWVAWQPAAVQRSLCPQARRCWGDAPRRLLTKSAATSSSMPCTLLLRGTLKSAKKQPMVPTTKACIMQVLHRKMQPTYQVCCSIIFQCLAFGGLCSNLGFFCCHSGGNCLGLSLLFTDLHIAEAVSKHVGSWLLVKQCVELVSLPSPWTHKCLQTA